MRRNNDRMLLESLVRKYGKNGVKNAINEMSENNNPVAKYIKFAEPLENCFDDVLPESYIKDIENFLGKPFNKCLSFWEGHYGDENYKAYEILRDLGDENIIKRKSYQYLSDPDDDYVDDDYDYYYSDEFDVYFCKYNGFKFITQGGSGDDYCAII